MIGPEPDASSIGNVNGAVNTIINNSIIFLVIIGYQLLLFLGSVVESLDVATELI